MFEKYIGQDHIKDLLTTFIAYSKSSTEPLQHMLITGGSGLGKTTLANAIAKELGVYNQVKQDEQRIEQARLEAQRKEERLRRGAQYQQAVQERSRKPQSRNALDNL